MESQSHHEADDRHHEVQKDCRTREAHAEHREITQRVDRTSELVLETNVRICGLIEAAVLGNELALALALEYGSVD